MAKKTLPKVSVVDRRKLHPFGVAAEKITIKTPGEWVFRWGNSKAKTGRLHQLIAELGYVPVTPDELFVSPEDMGCVGRDERVVRGEHGEEVLFKMSKKDNDEIQMAKARENLKNLGGRQMRDSVAQEAAIEHGSQAGDAVARQFDRMEITDSREQVELEPDVV